MDVDKFLDRILFMMRNFGACDDEDVVRACLLDLGLPCHVTGYRFLIYGTAQKHKDPDAMITKDIYPAIAKRFGCTVVQAEAACRRIIQTGWNNRKQNWSHYFSEDKRPSNDEFICVMCEYLAYWEVCKRSYKQLMEDLSQKS